MPDNAGEPTSLKVRLKRYLQAKPAIWGGYWSAKQQVRRVALLRYFLHDMANVYSAMYWSERRSGRTALSSELLFQYHKLEKGLVMPGPRRLFGIEPALAVMDLCRRWQRLDLPLSDPVFAGAIETLCSYLLRLETDHLDPSGSIAPAVQQFLREFPLREPALSTPMSLPAPHDKVAAPGSFSDLAWARRSVRDFQPMPVSVNVLRQAARDAQLSPSACNRQPCRIRVISEDKMKAALLRLQNGNRGFGDRAPHIAVVTADARCFFDASERHEPYIDGGLFAMSFILSLRDQGVGSCCLNWCVSPQLDKAAHALLGLPAAERIVMLIAIGYEAEGCMVPRSARRDEADVLILL